VLYSPLNEGAALAGPSQTVESTDRGFRQDDVDAFGHTSIWYTHGVCMSSLGKHSLDKSPRAGRLRFMRYATSMNILLGIVEMAASVLAAAILFSWFRVVGRVDQVSRNIEEMTALLREKRP